MVGTDTGGDGELKLLGFGETLSSEVAGVESVMGRETRQFNGSG